MHFPCVHLLLINWVRPTQSLLTHCVYICNFGYSPENETKNILPTMVYGITVRLADMKALVVTKQHCTNCIGSRRETCYTEIFASLASQPYFSLFPLGGARMVGTTEYLYYARTPNIFSQDKSLLLSTMMDREIFQQKNCTHAYVT